MAEKVLAGFGSVALVKNGDRYEIKFSDDIPNMPVSDDEAHRILECPGMMCSVIDRRRKETAC